MIICGPTVAEYDILLTQLKTLSDVNDRDADGRGAGRNRAVLGPIVMINLSTRERSCHCKNTM